MTQLPAGSGPPFGPIPTPAAHWQASGPVRGLAVLAAVLGLALYLLGFVGEVSVTSSFGGPMLIAGGLLAGTASLPRVGRVLAPAAVVTGTGALLLLQTAIGIGGPTVMIVGVGLGFLETTAVVGALLLDIVPARGARLAPPYPPGRRGSTSEPTAGLAPRHGPAEFDVSGPARAGGPRPYAGQPAALDPAPPAHQLAPADGASVPSASGSGPADSAPGAGPGPSGQARPPPGTDRPSGRAPADPAAAFAPRRPPGGPRHGAPEPVPEQGPPWPESADEPDRTRRHGPDRH